MKTRSRVLLVTLLSRVGSPGIKVLIRGLGSRTIITWSYGLNRMVMVIVMKVRLVHGRGSSRRSWKIWRILLMRVPGMGRVVPMVGVFGVVKWGIFGPRWHGILRWYGHDYSKLETDPWVILLPSAGGAELNSGGGGGSGGGYEDVLGPVVVKWPEAKLIWLLFVVVSTTICTFFSQKCHNKFRIAMKETRHFPGPNK